MRYKEYEICVSCETVQEERVINECYYCGGNVRKLCEDFEGRNFDELGKRWDNRAGNGVSPERYGNYDNYKDFMNDLDSNLHGRELQEVREYLKARSKLLKDIYGDGCEIADAIVNMKCDISALAVFEGTLHWHTD